ncbi:MAG: DciA family protein [Candidatus Omnitrophota bacterium]
MEGIKSVLSSVLKDLTRQQKERNLDGVQAAWERAAGKAAVRHTRITNLTKDKIQVNVDSSAWLYQLNLKKQAMEKELYRRLKIREIRLRLGDVREDNGRR